MKSVLLTALMIVSVGAIAKETKTSARETAALKDDHCKSMVRHVILTTARNMGLDEKIGFQIEESEDSGKERDRVGNVLYKFNTDIFKVDEGTLENSGASAVARRENGRCQIHKLTINIGD